MTEYDVQYAIIHHWQNSGNMFIPNLCSGYGEMDVLRLTKAGYAYEFEVKISRSDFKADIKKTHKHHCYSVVFEKKTDAWIEHNGKKGIPNYFAYVAPKGIIPVELVPEYAGLYEFDESTGLIITVKTPPRIHNEKQKDFWETKALQSLHAKYLYHYWFKLKESKAV
jgi:hypothetical protein